MKRTELKRGSPLSRSSSKGPKRGPVSAASREQRAKVEGHACIVCGIPPEHRKIDPAHLIDRSLGGCDDPDCVVPLCRICHDRYDAHSLDLSAYLEPRWRAEVAHAVLHKGLWLTARRISGRRHSDGVAA